MLTTIGLAAVLVQAHDLDARRRIFNRLGGSPLPVCDECPSDMRTVEADNACGYECVETVYNCDYCPEGMITVPSDNTCGFDCMDYDMDAYGLRPKSGRCASKWWKFWECFMPKFEVVDEEGNVIKEVNGRRLEKSEAMARRRASWDRWENLNHDTSNDRSEFSNSIGFNGLSNSNSGFEESFSDDRRGNSGFSSSDPWGSSSGSNDFFDISNGGRKSSSFDNQFTGMSGREDIWGQSDHSMNDDRSNSEFDFGNGNFGSKNTIDMNESKSNSHGFNKVLNGPNGLLHSHTKNGFSNEDKSHNLNEESGCTTDRFGIRHCTSSSDESKSHNTEDFEEEHEIHHDPLTGLKTTITTKTKKTTSHSSKSSHSSSSRLGLSFRPDMGFPTDSVFCTQDVRICDDGINFVSRNPDNDCAFDPCPADIVFCASDVRSCPDGSFVSRDPENDCAFDLCPETADQFDGATVALKAACGGQYYLKVGHDNQPSSWPIAGHCERFKLTKDRRTADEYNLQYDCGGKNYLSVGHDNVLGTFSRAGHCQRFKITRDTRTDDDWNLQAACGRQKYLSMGHDNVPGTFGRAGHCQRFKIDPIVTIG